MNLTFKRAEPVDWSTIQKLNLEVFADSQKYDKFINMEWVMSEKGDNYFKKVTSNKDYFAFIAEMDQKAVGYLVGGLKKIEYRKVRTAEIENMGISPTYRSKGIGSKLIEEFKKWCKDDGYQTVYVNAYFQNKRGIEFYKRSGFTPIDLSLEVKL